MILDRILCAFIVSLAAATVITAVTLTFTGIPPLLAFATLLAAGLLWLVRRTVRESVREARR